jgi:hypothetical protein
LSVEILMTSINRFVAALILLIAGCGGAQAHSFGTTYNLPIPFWMYAFAASATLVLSFLMIGFVLSGGGSKRVSRAIEIEAVVPRISCTIFRCLSVSLLALTVLTGLFGTERPFNNFSLTFFWIGFVLGFAYLTALIGDVYEFINPWRVICDAIEWFRPMAFKGRVRYPAWLAYYPALLLYMGFIWLELFGHTTPRTLGLILMGYTVLNFAAAACLGADAWFHYGEFFAVFFRLLAKISPIAYVRSAEPSSNIKIRFRQPFAALIEETAENPSVLLFVLFMLSSTAFDGVHETLPFVQIFWKYLYPTLDWAISQPYSFFVALYYFWQWVMLWLSPFIYLVVYLTFVWMMTGSGRSLRDRALMLCYSLIPIAFVYNVGHYFTLLFTDGPRLLPLISDPFGVGEDFFGTTHLAQQPIIPPASFVWHTQVGLILLGHLFSVYLAHVKALQIFPEKRKALWSQFPMLILMIVFTTVGLWILSLPIGAGQVIDPLPTLSALPPPKTVGDVAGGSGTTHPVMTWLRMKELSPGKEQRGSVSSLPMPALHATS